MKRIYTSAFCAAVCSIIGCSGEPGSGDDPSIPAAPVVADEAEAKLGAPSMPANDEERLEAPASAVDLGWRELGRPGSVAVTAGTTLGLELSNTTDRSLVLHVELSGDDGGQVERSLDLGEIILEAGGRSSVVVDVARLRLAVDAMAYSGQLQVATSVREADGSVGSTAISGAVYFHATAPGALTFYDETALRDTFRHGDYRGTMRDLESDPELAGIARITEAGAGNARGPALDPLAEDVTTLPVPAAASNAYRTCVLFRSRTTDSGVPIGAGPNKGLREDYHADWNTQKDVTAYGARVVMSQGGWTQTFDADPITGCFNWNSERAGSFNVRIYAYSKNSRGAFVRVHDDVNDFGITPGTAYSHVMTGYKPVAGGTNYLAAGGGINAFTSAAIVSFGLRRFAKEGPANAAFQLAIDNTPDDPKTGEKRAYSSAHWGRSNAYLTSGRHYLRVRNLDVNPQSRSKFVLGHEFGHAFAALSYGARDGAKNGGEPNVASDFQTGPENGCGMSGLGYSMYSQEWSSIGFREGFAHFLAAVMWNNQERGGSFDWMGSHVDLTQYGNGAGKLFGGRLENVCTMYGNKKGSGTNEDWLIFFWEYFTGAVSKCTQQPSLTDMLALYGDTRENGGLQKDNYYQKMRDAAAARTSLPSCMKVDRFEALADYNAIDH